MTRCALIDALTAARYCSGISLSALTTAKLRLCHSTVAPVCSAASRSQREVIHVQGQTGSKKNWNVSVAIIGKDRSAAVPLPRRRIACGG